MNTILTCHEISIEKIDLRENRTRAHQCHVNNFRNENTQKNEIKFLLIFIISTIIELSNFRNQINMLIMENRRFRSKKTYIEIKIFPYYICMS